MHIKNQQLFNILVSNIPVIFCQINNISVAKYNRYLRNIESYLFGIEQTFQQLKNVLDNKVIVLKTFFLQMSDDKGPFIPCPKICYGLWKLSV